MKIGLGSLVTHPLFFGPGVVMNIHESNNKKIIEVFWQSMLKTGYHSLDHLELITETFKEEQ